MGTVEDPTVPILKKGCFYECCSNGGNVMKTTKHMTIRQKLNTEKAAGIVCTMPFIVGFLAFMIIPMCISLYYSFCDYNILQPPTFTGWANFKRMFSDATFYQSLVVTFKFAIISVPLRLIFALIVALLLFKSTKMTGVYRALYYLPSIIGGSVAVAILWKRLFAVDGLVNKLLMVFGMKEPVAWLGDTRTAIWTLIILAVWQFGSSMLIFLSALKQIPVSLYEAARVDGATPLQQFTKITLPVLKPITYLVVTLGIIWSFQVFDLAYLMTGGGPGHSSVTLVMGIYNAAFKQYKMGYACAMAMFLLLMIIIINVVEDLFFKEKKEAK